MLSSRDIWLVVVPYMPRPDRASGDRRLVAMLEHVSSVVDIHIVSLAGPEPDDAYHIAMLAASGITFAGHGVRAAVRAMVRTRLSLVLFEFWFTTHRLLPLARALQPGALLVIDSVDLHFRREAAAVAAGAAPMADAEQRQRSELAAYGKADVILVVSESEADILLASGITGDVLMVPNIVPILPRTARERDPSVLFVGSFTHAPNAAAVEWFRREIWPRVRAQVPEARWVIAGSSTPPSIFALDGVDGIHVAGHVPSTALVMDAAQVSVAPLTYGAGMKGKVSEALAAGLPVVTTSWGAQGLEQGAGHAFLQADDAEAFADAVVLLLRDGAERERLSRAGQSLARATCSSDAATPALEELWKMSWGRRDHVSITARGLAVARAALRHLQERRARLAPEAARQGRFRLT